MAMRDSRALRAARRWKMHASRTTAMTVLLVLAAAMVRAPRFNSGSPGSDRDLTVDQNTPLDVPPDGIFNFRTVTVNGGSLHFRPNALNTPVFVLATGDIRLATDTSINVDGSPGSSIPPVGGAGGPGGFAGGDPGIDTTPPGAGHGPGGGLGGDASAAGTSAGSAGAAAYGSPAAKPSTSDGAVYGSPLLIPMVGGSGGGGGSAPASGGLGTGGSGGGGAILLASNTRIVISGNLVARGGTSGSLT